MHGRLQEVPTGFDWEKFCVLDKWSLKGGGRLRELVVNGGSTGFGFLYHDNFHNELMRNKGQFFLVISIARLHKTETLQLV